jgi:hypothetical protein
MAEGGPESKSSGNDTTSEDTKKPLGSAFLNEDGKLVVSKQIAEYIHGISKTIPEG